MKEKRFADFHRSPWSWALLLAYCLFLLGGALWYQAANNAFPCKLCIDARLWLIGVALAALAGLFAKGSRPARIVLLLILLGLTIGLGTTVWGLLKVDYEFGSLEPCSFIMYPDWLPLDRWWPSMFQVMGACTPTPEILGIGMADVLALTFVIFLAAFAYALIRDAIGILRK